MRTTRPAPLARKPDPSPAPPLAHETAEAYRRRTTPTRVHIQDPGAFCYRVLLNGAELKRCFQADSAEGWARCYEPAAMTRTMTDVPTFTRYGKVEIVHESDPRLTACCSDNPAEARFCRHCGKALEGTFTRTHLTTIRDGETLASVCPKIGSTFPGEPDSGLRADPRSRVAKTRATPHCDGWVRVDVTYSRTRGPVTETWETGDRPPKPEKVEKGVGWCAEGWACVIWVAMAAGAVVWLALL